MTETQKLPTEAEPMPLGQAVIPRRPGGPEAIEGLSWNQVPVFGLDWHLGCLVFCFVLSIRLNTS